MEAGCVKPSIHLALILGMTGSCFTMASSPVAQLQEPESTRYFIHVPCLVSDKGEGGRGHCGETYRKAAHCPGNLLSWHYVQSSQIISLVCKRPCCFCSELKPLCPCYGIAQRLQQVMCTHQLANAYPKLGRNFLYSEAFWNSLFLEENAGSCSA